jgi:hypothetical protein
MTEFRIQNSISIIDDYPVNPVGPEIHLPLPHVYGAKKIQEILVLIKNLSRIKSGDIRLLFGEFGKHILVDMLLGTLLGIQFNGTAGPTPVILSSQYTVLVSKGIPLPALGINREDIYSIGFY